MSFYQLITLSITRSHAILVHNNASVKAVRSTKFPCLASLKCAWRQCGSRRLVEQKSGGHGSSILTRQWTGQHRGSCKSSLEVTNEWTRVLEAV